MRKRKRLRRQSVKSRVDHTTSFSYAANPHRTASFFGMLVASDDLRGRSCRKTRTCFVPHARPNTDAGNCGCVPAALQHPRAPRRSRERRISRREGGDAAAGRSLRGAVRRLRRGGAGARHRKQDSAGVQLVGEKKNFSTIMRLVRSNLLLCCTLL